MSENVLFVFVLVGHRIFLRLRLGVRLGEIDRAVAQAGRRAKRVVDDLEVSAGYFQQDLFLQRDFVRHHRPQVVAARARHRGQADPGVAGGRFDQAAAIADLALFLQFAQHRPRGAVFDRTKRVIPFKLGVELELRRRIHLINPHQRRRILLAGQHLKYIVINAGLVVHLRCALT